jgi:hypothetical protein
MADEITELEFSLEDVSAGQPLSPETVDLPTLRGYLDEVEKLIRSDLSPAALADSRVRIEKGSLKVVAFVAQFVAAGFRADMAMLEATGDLDSIQPRRAEVIDVWQTRIRKSPTRSYSILPEPKGRPLRLTQNHLFQHASENAWVRVEKYLTGKLVNAGGKQTPNVHIVLADSGKTEVVNATEGQLAAENNQLYKQVTLWVEAEQNIRSKGLRNIRLLRILPQSESADEELLANLWNKGREAWRNVSSATDWVESLRGNK